MSNAASPGPASLLPARPPPAQQLTASLMILVMTALGRFKSSGLSAIATAGAEASSASGLLFRHLPRPDFPRRYGLTLLGFRSASRCPHYVPQCPARQNRSSASVPSLAQTVGASEVSTLQRFWPARASVRPRGARFSPLCHHHVWEFSNKIKCGSPKLPSIPHHALCRC